jgi:putative two-component system response regulator
MAKTTPSVLIVEDEDINAEMLQEILKKDYEIITASNGKIALDMLRTAVILPKLILLDIIMPVMNGRQMFEIMKEDSAFKRIPVIFITAANDSESELLAAGAVDFINKPFLPEIVQHRVRNQIELKNYSDSLEEMVAEKTNEATKTLENALQGLANIIEHRDLESGEHVKRTQLYVQALCNYLILNGSEYAQEVFNLKPDIIIKSMALHDVGKIAIPDRILLKPGRLDPDEYDIMKTHTTRGKEIIAELGDVHTSLYLKHCQDICFGHHERWDGKGYPRQIAGTDIPLTARLAAIADVYDALVCARVYKAAFPYSEAVKIITDGRATQFDPVLADAMPHLQNRFQEIAEKYK